MAKKPNKREDSALLMALRFVQAAQLEVGVPYQTHCRFVNGQVVAFNGVLAAGHPVPEEVPICPHTFRLINALERVTGPYSFTALDSKQLVVKSDKFKAIVSSIGDGDLTYSFPDEARFPISDDFRRAANIASTFNTEGAQTVMAASVVTRDGTIVGTNGQVVLEVWHGIPTPPGLIIPKAFITALDKIKWKLIRFGFSDNSLTFYFENGAWLKTQLYQEAYPNVDQVLAYTDTAKPVEIPRGLFEAVRTVTPFCEGAYVWSGDGQIRSHEHAEYGATYTLKDAPQGQVLNFKEVLALEEVLTRIDFTGNERVICIFGDRLRGCIAKRDFKPTPSATKSADLDKDIPF